ncbi:MAG: hypothetical protein O6948_00090, partial [Deltaproteobacteria bacterium]|nr:hypothetical protein [Deltaproteobacteria bacterium]
EYHSDKFAMQDARETLSKQGIVLHSLITWDDILEIAREENYFTRDEYEQVLSFLKDPNHWWKNLSQ